MKYFIDCEFMEDGRTIDLLSLAIVAEDDREFYAVNDDADLSKANDWVKENVIPQLRIPTVAGAKGPGVEVFGGLAEIRKRVLEFIPLVAGPNGKIVKPHIWGYFADYDWVAFCQLFGRMIDLPKGFPMYCRDIKQACDSIGNPDLPPQGKGEHHALLDARWNKVAYEFLMAQAAQRGLVW